MDLKTFKKFSKLGYRINEIAQCEAVFELSLNDLNYNCLEEDESLENILEEASEGEVSETNYHDESPTFDIYNKQSELVECGLTLKEVETFITEAVKEAGSK